MSVKKQAADRGEESPDGNKGPILFADRYYFSDAADIRRMVFGNDEVKVFLRDGSEVYMPGKAAADAAKEWVNDRNPMRLQPPGGAEAQGARRVAR